MSSWVYRFYQTPGLSPGTYEVILSKLKGIISGQEIVNFDTELCFYVNADQELSADEQEQLQRLFSKSFEARNTTTISKLKEESSSRKIINIEIGPRLNFSTAFSTNAVSICQSVGLNKVDRIEQSMHYLIELESKDKSKPFSCDDEQRLVDLLHDRMTECRYLKPIESFAINIKPQDYYDVDIIGKGRPALEKVNTDLGLAFDDWDLEYYTNLFKERVGRNPTNVECFDLAQSNSEHSRHWFFRGRLVIDGIEIENSLMKMVIKTQETSNDNNVIKFSDNSSAIKGFEVPLLKPKDVKTASKFLLDKDTTRHIIFSAETHNFPTGVAPFPGATTGTGGRIRDVQAAGRGAYVVAGTAGYCFGNLHIPGYSLPWEEDGSIYPSNMAPALEVAVQASNGASDYGNKFGEPVITGFARSFGMNLANDERREWIKPIMFSGGMGMLDADNIKKLQPELGMEVVKVGGPVYRIGVGGGAASSIQVQGDNVADLDFGAVQRGDAEMEQKMNRAIRACLEMGSANPICSIHDQGAGGNGNVLKEICEPAGATIRAQDFILGDPTLSILELWGAEYQESNALLVKKEDIPHLKEISAREKVPVSVVGSITGNGRIVLEDNKETLNGQSIESDSGKATKRQKTESYPVDLELDVVLGKMPRKVFNLERVKPMLTNLQFSQDPTVHEALNRVLRLPSVASKRYLTNKVDRSVTGLIAQQQCVGPLHTPLADVAVTALSHFDTKGSATAIGEQPIKMLVDPSRGARMAVGEALTNLVFAKISDLKDVKCSANWMWAAKLPGEGAALFDACQAMCDVMAEIGIAVDGGKDSLSMAARVGKKTVKAPGALVVSVYAACPDITQKVTPDLKLSPHEGILVYVDMSNSKQYRLGGSALAQVYNQIGDTCPDLDDVKSFVSSFNITQSLIAQNLITSGHDVSDGGLITTILEMAFAGNRGLDVELDYLSKDSPFASNAIDLLFAEELGLVLEVTSENLEMVLKNYKSNDVSCCIIGKTGETGKDAQVTVKVDGAVVLQEKVVDLRDIWEATSFQLERLQCNPLCVEAEEAGLRHRKDPPYSLSFQPEAICPEESTVMAPQVAVIREEGSNGDREMVAAFHMAGFEVWDVTMSDICKGSVDLNMFRGVVFVGGFSYADVLGSAKGWAAVCQMNENARQQFEAFMSRDDTFSLGICNGCQLMGLLGWIASDPDASSSDLSPTQGVCFTHNTSERFESRFVTVNIEESPAIMLKGMEGSTLGVWVAHGEGRAEFRHSGILQSLLSHNLAPVRFVDDNGSVTMQYPLNPNGSPEGIAAICSPNGRHLAMMPHPERCTLLWQWPWMPEDWRQHLRASPWLKMFCNAYDWCLEKRHN